MIKCKNNCPLGKFDGCCQCCPENKPVVNHKRGRKHDCRASQLEWATISENTKHAGAHGLTHRGGVKARGR